MLSNISFLHQTTTQCCPLKSDRGCQISLFYIKPQPSSPVSTPAAGCQISLFYIKPQHTPYVARFIERCQISLFYIKPQHRRHSPSSRIGCQISLFYIKPQLVWEGNAIQGVVKYLFSTSNHN